MNIAISVVSGAAGAVAISMVTPFSDELADRFFGADDGAREFRLSRSAGTRHYEEADSDGWVVASAFNPGRVGVIIKEDCREGSPEITGFMDSGQGGTITIPVTRGQCWEVEIGTDGQALVYWIESP